MKKIVYLSLDERPCNYKFPYQLFNDKDFKVVRIDKKYMGYKKTPANVSEIHKWLLKETKDADGLVLSIDTLIYGGIVPSRLHYENLNKLIKK